MAIVNPGKYFCWGTAKLIKGTYIVGGVKPGLFEIMSQTANFTPDYFVSNYIKPYDAEVFFHVFDLRTHLGSELHMTTSFIELREIVITTPGELYTSYEKLWLPFDDATWTILISTFLIAFAATFVIYQLPIIIQIGVFGENVKTPSLNVFSTFFGIPQIKLPKSHIPRFILILFVFMCLIFRTCYQSKLFEFLTSEPRRIAPQTLQDLVDNGFKVYWTEDNDGKLNKTIENDEKHWPQIHFHTDEENYKMFMTQSKNASAKIAMIAQELTHKMFEHYGYNIKWHKLPNYCISVSQSGFAFLQNNFFFRIVDETVQRLTSAGIINRLIEQCYPLKGNRFEAKAPSVLKIEDLDFGFVIWIGCCAACVACFVAESLFWMICNILKDLKDKSTTNKLKFAKVSPGTANAQQIDQCCLKDQYLFRINKPKLKEMCKESIDGEPIDHELNLDGLDVAKEMVKMSDIKVQSSQDVNNICVEKAALTSAPRV
ncbi:unnamed protein product [Chironomus riparius]|uniref:Ionotropic receptor n=1 Tax=Chironomus riparius TaxID=315576 RepID=A0A9N9S468_9DIPT|nr:unnamed protein product [Chironomus riparius]